VIEDKRYYTVKEIMKILRFNRFTVTKYLKQIPYLKIGVQYRWLGKDINERFGKNN